MAGLVIIADNDPNIVRSLELLMRRAGLRRPDRA